MTQHLGDHGRHVRRGGRTGQWADRPGWSRGVGSPSCPRTLGHEVFLSCRCRKHRPIETLEDPGPQRVRSAPTTSPLATRMTRKGRRWDSRHVAVEMPMVSAWTGSWLTTGGGGGGPRGFRRFGADAGNLNTLRQAYSVYRDTHSDSLRSATGPHRPRRSEVRSSSKVWIGNLSSMTFTVLVKSPSSLTMRSAYMADE
jgi:hypothetical protein